MDESKQDHVVKIDNATYGRVRRISKREGRTMRNIMHRAVREYDVNAKIRSLVARDKGDTP